MRIMKWWELIRWNRIKVNKTWFLVSMRRRLFLKDKENLKSMKRSSWEDLQLHNKIEPIISKPWKRLLRDKEKQSSGNSNKRSWKEELPKKVLREWEMISMLKNKKRKLDKRNKLNTTKKFNKKKSSKPPKIINSNSRPKDYKRKREWKMSSR